MTDTAVSRFIMDAIAGGWNIPTRIEEGASSFFVSENGGERREVLMIQGIFLDPDVWQAVGKTRRWIGKHTCHWYGNDCDTPKWRCHMLHCVDALCDGKTIEEYLTAIEY